MTLLTQGRPGAGSLRVRHRTIAAWWGLAPSQMCAETERPKDAPDLRLAELDAIHALDENTDALERP